LKTAALTTFGLLNCFLYHITETRTASLLLFLNEVWYENNCNRGDST